MKKVVATFAIVFCLSNLASGQECKSGICAVVKNNTSYGMPVFLGNCSNGRCSNSFALLKPDEFKIQPKQSYSQPNFIIEPSKKSTQSLPNGCDSIKIIYIEGMAYGKLSDGSYAKISDGTYKNLSN